MCLHAARVQTKKKSCGDKKKTPFEALVADARARFTQQALTPEEADAKQTLAAEEASAGPPGGEGEQLGAPTWSEGGVVRCNAPRKKDAAAAVGSDSRPTTMAKAAAPPNSHDHGAAQQP